MIFSPLDMGTTHEGLLCWLGTIADFEGCFFKQGNDTLQHAVAQY